MNFLGINIGTSGCKALVFDVDGKFVAGAQRQYELHVTGDGGAKLEAPEVLDQCLAVITEAAGRAGRGSVKGMGISSQGEAFTPVDRRGNPLARAMVSSDVRAGDYARRWPLEFGEERLYEITGHTAHPLFTLFKLLWCKEHRAEVWERASKFLCFEESAAVASGAGAGDGMAAGRADDAVRCPPA